MSVAYNKVMNTGYACNIELIDSYNNTLTSTISLMVNNPPALIDYA